MIILLFIICLDVEHINCVYFQIMYVDVMLMSTVMFERDVSFCSVMDSSAKSSVCSARELFRGTPKLHVKNEELLLLICRVNLNCLL